MNKYLRSGLMALFLLPGLAHAGFEEGRHYMVLPFPVAVETGDKIEVREFFWYGCPHCYVLEPALAEWLKKLPANARFVSTPGTLSAKWETHAQAFYTFEALGVTKKLHGAFFKAVQEQKQGEMNSEKGIADFAVQQGIDRKKFDEAYKSFGVDQMLKKAKLLNQDVNIGSVGVPSVVVDGKYLTSPSMTGGEQRFFKVLDELIGRAAKERKQRPATK